jgi:uronate dehydrogenase
MSSILITGAAGVVGTVLARGLRETYDLSGVDCKRTRHLRSSVADTRQFDEIAPLFEGKDAVVDLAAAASPSLSWDDAVRNNIASTRNVLEAALHASVPRVVFASSNRVTGLYERDSPYAEIVAGAYERLSPHDIPYIRVDQPVRPDGPYAVAKVFGEAAARFYADVHGLSVICVRLGTVLPRDRPTRPRHYATLLTHRDLVSLVDCCLNAPRHLRFETFYGVSSNTWRFWEIDNARRIVGYNPADDAEVWR